MHKALVKNINGLTTIFAPLNEGNSVTVQLFVKAGSLYETKDTNGISHFLEHMFFKGGKRYTTPKAVAQAVESFGGEFNAYTGNEIASYYVKSAPQYGLKALDVLADMMVNAQFPEDEMQREKGVVIQEIKMYEDRPQSVVADKRNEWYYGDNPYGWTILGPAKNINSFTREHLFNHQRKLYAKDNMILMIAGKIEDQDEYIALIEKLFVDLPEHAVIHKEQYKAQLPTSDTAYYNNNTSQNHLILSAPGFPYKDEKRFYAAKVMMVILGGNMSSRLFQNIREKLGLCYYIGARFSVSQYDGVFMIRAGMDKQNFEMGVEHIYSELEVFVNQGITDQELEDAKSYLLGSLQMGIESSDELSSFLGGDYLLYGELSTIDHLIENYKNITKQDVEDLLHYLKREHLYLYYIQ